MDDLIRRQAAIDAILGMFLNIAYSEKNIAWSMALDKIRQLPTAEKRGKWIDYCGDLKCDQCGCEADLFGIRGEWNYCPNCGAKMEN